MKMSSNNEDPQQPQQQQQQECQQQTAAIPSVNISNNNYTWKWAMIFIPLLLRVL